MSQALYRKWRPRQWDEVVGQEHVLQTIRNAVSSQTVRHAYLFAGPRGTGKTTMARLLAKAVNCLAERPEDRPCNQCAHCQSVNDGNFLDLIEIDAASNTSVEDVRDLRDKINFSPNQGRFKVYIIDEVHMLSTAAFNALLKTLEEPPPHAIFILATTEVHKIPATVLSRCQRHEFRRIPVTGIIRQLKDLAEQEQITIDEKALETIARQATGSMRDAISLLDQLASTGKEITQELAQTVLGTATSQSVIALIGAVLKEDPADGLNQIHRALDAGTDPRQFARQVVEYLRSLLLIRMGSSDQVDTASDVKSQMTQHAQAFDTARLLEALRAFNNAAVDTRGGWYPGLLLEIAFTEVLEPKAVPVYEQPAVPARVPTHATAPAQVEPRPRPAPQTAPPQVHTTPPVPAKEVSAGGSTANRPQPAARPAPEPTVSPAQPSAAPTQPASGISFQSLIQNWPKIRAVIKKSSPQTEALLNSGKLLGIKDGALIIGFSPVLKGKMETGNNLEITSRGIAQVTGVQLNVQCTLTSGKTSSMPSDIDVESDGMVGTALRDLGGEVVDVQ